MEPARDRRRAAWTASLRFRLASWYGIMVTVVLSAISVSLYLGARHAMIQETDQFLAAVAHRLTVSARSGASEEALTAAVGNLDGALDSGPINQANLPIYLQHPLGFLDLAQTSIRVLGADDLRPVALSRRLRARPDLQTPMDIAVRHAMRTPTYQFEDADTAKGTSERVVTRYCACRPKNLFIQVSTPWDRNADLLARLRLLLESSVLVGLMLAVLGGWLIVARSLRPVDRLVTEVGELGEEDFAEASRLLPREADGEIGRLVAAFNHLVTRLSRSLDAQKRFAEDAAHELQTPATVLRLQLETALRRPRSAAELQATIQTALEETERISRIVDNLSFAARSDANTAGDAPGDAPVDLGALIEECARHCRPIAAQKQISLQVGAGRGGPAAGDTEQLRQVIRNLLDNAIKYTATGGRIDIAAEIKSEATGQDMIVISVADTGCGLDDDELPYVFERFWRSTRAPRTKGTGLGLAICERIVRRHGGTIGVARRPGGGSVFSVALPAWTAEGGLPELLEPETTRKA